MRRLVDCYATLLAVTVVAAVSVSVASGEVGEGGFECGDSGRSSGRGIERESESDTAAQPHLHDHEALHDHDDDHDDHDHTLTPARATAKRVTGDVVTREEVDCVCDDDSRRGKGRVLVLGSGGLIGAHLVAELRRRELSVVEVRSRAERDLRVPGSLASFNCCEIDFVFFLAFEVGGSKFIESSEPDTQLAILRSNIELYSNVFPWLQERAVPFLFYSSSLQTEATPYGSLKRVGEMWVDQLPLGKVVRLWNVYGVESPGLRRHVVGDWASACLEFGQAVALTDGHEHRQFLHVNDSVDASIRLMDGFETTPKSVDVSSREWTSLRRLAATLEEVAQAAGLPCKVSFSEKPAQMRTRAEPRPHPPDSPLATWTPKVSLSAGLRSVLDAYAVASSSEA